MPGAPTHKIADKRSLEASQWLARLERGLTSNEGQDLREWLKNTRNRDVILDAAGLWHSSDVHSLLCTLVGVSRHPQRGTTPQPKKRTLRLPLTVALCSTVALLAILWSGRMPWAAVHGSHAAQASPPTAIYDTAIGETKQVALVDGTVVMLNTGTRVSVSFSPRARDVTLVRGEASFTVAPDGSRPFIVMAGRRHFQAFGTRFNLRTLPRANVELTVMAGQVKVLDAPPRMPDTPARRRDVITYGEQMVSALQEAIVEPGFQSVNHIGASEVETRLAWQQGMIVFDGKALQDVLAEVERYTYTKFVLADPKLGALRVSGQFRTGNVNAVRLALRQKFLVVSRRDTRGRIVLSPAQSG